MSLTATLSQPLSSVQPGDQVLLEVNVHNTGRVVDQYTFAVLGDAAPWATIQPPNLTLYPGAEGSVFVRFDVPRSAEVASGEVPFAVKVVSQEDAAGMIVEEGVLVIGAFADSFVEIVPRTARGRRRTRHQLALDNRGNARMNAVLQAGDADQQLRFVLQPPTLVAEPSTASFAQVTVRPRKAFLRGAPRLHPFQVVVETPAGQPPLLAEGSMLQEPLLPAWTVKAVLAALALLLLLALLWLTVLRPTLESAAKDAIKEPLSETNAAVNDLGAAVGKNPELPTDGKAIVDGGSPTTTVAPPGQEGAAASISTSFGNPFDRRLSVAGPGTVEDSFAVGGGKVFSLTDVVFENPAGDTGTLTLLRGGDVLFREALANFRTLDYHFVSPIVFDQGVDVVLRVECRNTGPDCTAAAHLAGFVKDRGGS